MDRADKIKASVEDTTLVPRLFANIHTFLSEQTKRLLPQEVDLSDVWNVLDVACGTGAWVIDMARTYQDMIVVGLDSNIQAIELAQMEAKAWRLDNARFVVGDMHSMPEVADDTYDLVHARFLAHSVSPQSWHAFLQELLRVCRPGGRIVWTEAEFPLTNSPACFQLCELIERSIALSGHTPDITQIMDALLSDTSCRHIQKSVTTIDLSAGTRAHTSMYRDIAYFLSALQPFLMHMHVASGKELDQICREMIMDLYANTFSASWSLVTVIGEKPKTDIVDELC